MTVDLSAVEGQLRQLGPVATFPWHKQQLYALRAATDVVAVIGGNRSGKSQVGAGILSRLVRREGPIYARLLEPRGRRLKVWVAPQTDEKARSVWEPKTRWALEGLEYRYVQSPHKVFSIEDDHGGVEVWLKSQEQGFLAFESDDVDAVIFDEEPEDRRVYASARTRLATTNGVVVLTYTPLMGMTWTYDEIFALCGEKPEYAIDDRVWRRGNEITVVAQGMADNAAAVRGGGVARLQADPSMTEAEKGARLYGKYGYTEGLLVPQFATLRTDSDSPYVLDKLPPDRAYYWILTVDPNKRHGALLTAIDHEGNRFYCAEHYAESLPDSVHAEGYHAMLRQFGLKPDDVLVYGDPGGAGSQALINLAEVGFYGSPVPKDPGSVAASIKRLRRAAHMDRNRKHPVTGESPAPSAYFLRTLESRWKEGGSHLQESRLLWELRQYRQKADAAPDTPVKKNDDLADCARYVELVHMDGPPVPVADEVKKQRAKLDSTSRREAEEYESMMEKVARTNRRYGVTA